ncbi:hypothetical protein BJ741DRAFT_667230 [Chytriomyces cf. hyalinus JEL632]|nr:hypothetical protein BJ741DRAFT_667230 [Chytriomyces cf. hyalinus JEL632]
MIRKQYPNRELVLSYDVICKEVAHLQQPYMCQSQIEPPYIAVLPSMHAQAHSKDCQIKFSLIGLTVGETEGNRELDIALIVEDYNSSKVRSALKVIRRKLDLAYADLAWVESHIKEPKDIIAIEELVSHQLRKKCIYFANKQMNEVAQLREQSEFFRVMWAQTLHRNFAVMSNPSTVSCEEFWQKYWRGIEDVYHWQHALSNFIKFYEMRIDNQNGQWIRELKAVDICDSPLLCKEAFKVILTRKLKEEFSFLERGRDLARHYTESRQPYVIAHLDQVHEGFKLKIHRYIFK